MKKILISIGLSFIVVYGLTLINFRNPIYQLTNEFYIQGYQENSTSKRNEEIVIVNIADLPTEYIKQQIEVLAFYKPAVIGVDYHVWESTPADSLVEFNNIVLPISLDSAGIFVKSNNPFTTHAEFGSINIQSYNYFQPFVERNGESQPFITTKILELYNQSLYRALVSRRHESEIINYAGNASNFIDLGDMTDLGSFDVLKGIKGKIVLVGYCGLETNVPSKDDQYDAHLTPRGNMFGVVYLANALHTSMGNFIEPLSGIPSVILVIFIIVVNCFFQRLLSTRLLHYFLLKLLQLVQLAIVLAFAFLVIDRFNVSIDFETMALAVIISPEIAFWFAKYASPRLTSNTTLNG